MERTIRAVAGLVLAAALSTALPVVALADPGPVDPSIATDVGGTSASATVSSTGSVTISPTTVTVTTTPGAISSSGTTATATAPTATVTSTGTSATAGAPATTVRVGTPGPVTSPDLSPPDLSGGSTSAQVSGAAGVNALICLLAELSVQPTSASVSSLCQGGPSVAGARGGLHGSDRITGASVDSTAAITAAACLLGLVGSPAPGHVSTSMLASASLSTLCGSDGSTAGAGGATGLGSERTGTSASAAPIVSAAICLLANGTAGDPTVAQLSSICSTPAGSASTVAGSAVVSATDGTTSSQADLAPAASAAVCVLVNAIARTPDASGQAAAADLATACGSGSAPTAAGVAGPAGATLGGGTGVGTVAAAAVATCILSNALAGTGGASLGLSDGCAVTVPGTTTPPAGGTTSPDASASAGGSAAADTMAGLGAAGAASGAGVAEPANTAGVLGRSAAGERSETPMGLSGLPSSATAIGGGLGLVIAAVAAMVLAGRGRRRS